MKKNQFLSEVAEDDTVAETPTVKVEPTPVVEPVSDVNPGYVRLQNLQAVEQAIPLTDGSEPIMLSPARGKSAISQPVLIKNLPTAFVDRLIKQKKIKRLV